MHPASTDAARNVRNAEEQGNRNHLPNLVPVRWRTGRKWYLRLVIALTLLMVPAGTILLTAQAQQGLPPANAQKFLNYVEQQNSYKGWHLFPGTSRMHVSTSQAHGALITTYVNQLAYDAARDHAPYPNGSIIVKENYNKQKKFKALTTMYKVAGYNPSGDNWFWIKASPNGKKVMKSGKVPGCMNCHSQAKTGYVFNR